MSEANATGSIPVNSSKGQLQAINLLIVYGLLSGLMLFVGFYLLFSSYGTLSVLELGELLSVASPSWNSKAGMGLVLVFLSGAVKLALCPFQVWLGKVHVEASTMGSVLLAAISLKTGFYLHLLISPGLNTITSGYVGDILLTVCLLGGAYSSFALFTQVDAKRWIALYSVSHMNLFYVVLLGVARTGTGGDTVLWPLIKFGMLGHSVVSGALFLMVGSLCDRWGTRSIAELSGKTGSLESAILLLLLCANSGYPLLVLFLYELMGFTLLVGWDSSLALVSGALSSLCLLSSLLLYTRLCTGSQHHRNSVPAIVLFTVLPLCVITGALGLQAFIPIFSLS